MKIKVIAKSGKSRILKVDSFETMEKIVNRFNTWEYK